jgi:hypothetical protein
MGLIRTRAFLTAGLMAVATAISAAAAGPATAQPLAPQPPVSLPGGQLFGVAATSASNAWAVGQDVGNGKTVILRWNGTAWKRVPSPTPAGGGSLYAVAATSASNAWAVGCAGNCFQGFGGIKTLILHWNGTAWKRVPSPSPGTGSSLSAVTAVSAHNAWAVGCTAFCFLSAASPHTVILHWNGTAWKQVASPAGATVGALNGIAASSAASVWAVGCAGHCFGPMATTKTMIVRWNGSTWKHIASPSPAGDSVLTAVTATSATSAWAAGYTRNSGKTLIMRWNGTSWKQVPSPTPGQFSQLLGVAATSTRNAWAVGGDLNGAIVQHWNGTAWK